MQEIWLTKNTGNFKLSNYHLPLLRQRTTKTGGGVGLYIKLGMKYQTIETPFTEGIIETIGVKIMINNVKTIILNVYRPPGRDLTGIQVIENWLSTIRDNVIIIGDFNINILRNSPLTRQFKQFMNRLRLTSTIASITRPDSSTCIDNILINKTLQKDYVSIVTSELIADHYSIELYTKHTIESIKIKDSITYRLINDDNNVRFLNKLDNINWDNIDTMNAEEGTNCMMDSIKKSFNDSYPLITRHIDKNTDAIKPWMTKHLLVRRFQIKKISSKSKKWRQCSENRIQK